MSIFEIGEQYELVGRNKKRRKFLIKKKKELVGRDCQITLAGVVT